MVLMGISVVRRTLLFVAPGKHWEHQTYLCSSLKHGEHLLRIMELASNGLIFSEIVGTVKGLWVLDRGSYVAVGAWIAVVGCKLDIGWGSDSRWIK